MRNVWHPSSLRVKRLSDGRIFTCSTAAARNLGLQIARQIEDVCDGYLSQVSGSKWDWEYSVPEIDFGDFNDLVRRVNAKLGLSSRREIRNSYKSTGKATSRSIRQKCYDVVEFFRKNTELYSEMTLITEVHAVYKKYCEDNSLYVQFFTSTSFARHLRAWYLLYFRTVGLLLYVRKLTVKPYQKRLCCCIEPKLVDPTFSIYDEIPDYRREDVVKETTLSRKVGNRGFPVYCYTTDTTYTSIKEASKATGVTKSDIQFCCNGDLPHIRLKGKDIKFKYGKWENVDETTFIRKYNVSRSSKTVLELNSNATFGSIREAAAYYGLSRVIISDYCNREDPGKGEGIPVRNLGQDFMTVKFKFVDSDTEEESWDDVLRAAPITT